MKFFLFVEILFLFVLKQISKFFGMQFSPNVQIIQKVAPDQILAQTRNKRRNWESKEGMPNELREKIKKLVFCKMIIFCALVNNMKDFLNFLIQCEWMKNEWMKLYFLLSAITFINEKRTLSMSMQEWKKECHTHDTQNIPGTPVFAHFTSARGRYALVTQKDKNKI